MEYICPYCGNIMQRAYECSNCHNDLKWLEKIYQISYKCYSKGYSEAENRNLTQAKAYLKKAIEYNKYNIEARNLLGLIYFEIGAIGEALKEWIISCSLKKNDNLANTYIEKIQGNLEQLVKYKEAISLYNQALTYVKQGNDDMAIIRLKKAISNNTNFIEAKALLALCYIKEKKMESASKQIMQVLEIDRGHTKALKYEHTMQLMKETNKDTNKEANKDTAISHLHKKPIRAKKTNIVLAVIIGSVVSAAGSLGFMQYKVLPQQTKQLNEQVIKLEETAKKQEVQIEQVQKQKEEVIKKQNIVEDKKTSVKEILVQVESLHSQGKCLEAAKLLDTIEMDWVVKTEKEKYETLQNAVYPVAAKQLYYKAYSIYSNEEINTAKPIFEKVLAYKPEDSVRRKTLYYLGNIAKEEGEIEKAKTYYETIITEYEQSREAKWADGELKSIS